MSDAVTGGKGEERGDDQGDEGARRPGSPAATGSTVGAGSAVGDGPGGGAKPVGIGSPVGTGPPVGTGSAGWVGPGSVQAPRWGTPPAAPTSVRLETYWTAMLGRLAPATWSTPARPGRSVPVGALASGLVAAMLLVPAGFGVNVLLVTATVTAAVCHPVLRRRETFAGGRFSIGATALAVLLGAVGVLRASPWLVLVCVLAAIWSAACAALGARTWRSVLGSGLLLGEAAIRSLPWVAASARSLLPRRYPARPSRAVLTGLASGVVCAGAVGVLLADADPAYAATITRTVRFLRFDVDPSDVLVARVLVGGAVALLVLGLGFAAASRIRQSSDAVQARHPGEWLPPLVLVAATIATFLAVEATRLFGAGEAVLQETAMTHAERAREGFGQLTVVTVLVLLLLGLAGRYAAPRHRPYLAMAGGALLVVTLLLAGSALRRLWLYQDAFGWTVTRLNAGAFELWTVALLFTVAVAWLIRRTDLLPRLGVGSAGIGLLVLALAGPDALVAAADVRRYEQTGVIDAAYLSRLSADAVPALMDLPEPVRSCALPTVDTDDAWYAWNLSRFRAGRELAGRSAADCGSGRSAGAVVPETDDARSADRRDGDR